MSGRKLVSANLLQGLIVDRYGRTMGPVHTLRNGQRFRCYVTHPKAMSDGNPAAYRLAAESIETICCAQLADHLGSAVASVDAHAKVADCTAVLQACDGRAKRLLILDHLRKIIIGDGVITIELNDGTRLERSIERIRHGNDARLVIARPSNLKVPDRTRSWSFYSGMRIAPGHSRPGQTSTLIAWRSRSVGRPSGSSGFSA